MNEDAVKLEFRGHNLEVPVGVFRFLNTIAHNEAMESQGRAIHEPLDWLGSDAEVREAFEAQRDNIRFLQDAARQSVRIDVWLKLDRSHQEAKEEQ